MSPRKHDCPKMRAANSAPLLCRAVQCEAICKSCTALFPNCSHTCSRPWTLYGVWVSSCLLIKRRWAEWARMFVKVNVERGAIQHFLLLASSGSKQTFGSQKNSWKCGPRTECTERAGLRLLWVEALLCVCVCVCVLLLFHCFLWCYKFPS
jgi:hypothetical protein